MFSGSPWTIEVRSAENVHTTADQLHLLPVNYPASFEVHAEVDGNVQVKITSKLSFLTLYLSLKYMIKWTDAQFVMLQN
jgi:hypothetical protein